MNFNLYFIRNSHNFNFATMERWVGKVAVVTGHATGIGEVCAIDLVKAGMIVVGLDIQTDRFSEVAKKIPKDAKGKLYSLKCDVRSEREIIDTFHWIEVSLGGTDVLINNAAVLRETRIVDADNSEAIRDVINTNMFGVVFCTREAFQSMKRRNVNGHIILMNSLGGHRVPHIKGLKSNSLNVYAPTKFAMTAMEEVLRQELYSLGTKIKITSLSPGPVRTEIFLPHDEDCLSEHLMLFSEDVSHAVMYILSTAPHVQIQELIMQVMGSQF